MDYVYGEFNGQPFPTPDSLFPPDKVIQFIIQYGQKALDAMDKLDGDEEKQYIEAMIQAGLLERDGEGNLHLTPKMLRGIEHKSLLGIFEGIKRGNKEGHVTPDRGRSDERSDGSKAYEFGDPLSEIDLGITMRNAMRRWHSQREEGAKALPIPIGVEDFELHLTEGQSDVATCLLLDMSSSMSRYGRFYQAKRVALGISALIRRRFPQDTLDYVGFHSLAERIREADLPLVMPRPKIIYDDGYVNLRVPLAKAQENPKKIPQHFTNLHLGLRMARQILSRRSAFNRQIFIITDGQPTAHVEPGKNGEEVLRLIYPPSEESSMATLREALRCQQQGIRIATFALIEDYWGMDWVGFVDQLSRLTHGIAFYCASEDLSSTVIESYLSGKRKKSMAK